MRQEAAANTAAAPELVFYGQAAWLVPCGGIHLLVRVGGNCFVGKTGCVSCAIVDASAVRLQAVGADADAIRIRVTSLHAGRIAASQRCNVNNSKLRGPG